MRWKSITCLLPVALLCGGCISIGSGRSSAHLAVSEAKPAQVLRHVVLFKFKDDSSEQDIRAIENAFCALPGKIDAIHDFEWGTDASTENLADGFTHCFVVTFRSEADRDAYIPHPAHKEFVELASPHFDKVLVVDFWTGG